MLALTVKLPDTHKFIRSIFYWEISDVLTSLKASSIIEKVQMQREWQQALQKLEQINTKATEIWVRDEMKNAKKKQSVCSWRLTENSTVESVFLGEFLPKFRPQIQCDLYCVHVSQWLLLRFWFSISFYSSAALVVVLFFLLLLFTKRGVDSTVSVRVYLSSLNVFKM